MMVQISKINKLQQKNKAKNLEIIKTVTLEICSVISFLLHVQIQRKKPRNTKDSHAGDLFSHFFSNTCTNRINFNIKLNFVRLYQHLTYKKS